MLGEVHQGARHHLEHEHEHVGPAQDGEPLYFVEGLQGAAGECPPLCQSIQACAAFCHGKGNSVTFLAL